MQDIVVKQLRFGDILHSHLDYAMCLCNGICEV